ADTRAREEEEARAAEPEAGPAPGPDKAADEIEREAARARTGRARALKRLGGMKERLVELEKGLATARQEARRAVEVRERVEAERPAASTAAWSLPVFTDEFYESIRGWDRKILRITFEKIYRLAEDWRHPSLRAIPLEGLPDCYRIRIASDVRLIYRPADGGRVEILSLIDREDLQRYIRQAKSR